MPLHLYHCTTSAGLRGILASQTFLPFFCLEKADYLRNSENFAFAMVCFADLLDDEVKAHMTSFHSSAYLRMNKNWAMKKGISPVCYYYKNSSLAASVRMIINKAVRELKAAYDNGDKDAQHSPFLNGVNVMMAYLKQYSGSYWKDGRWSPQTVFYTEREWRYVPLVSNNEAYYLPEKEFLKEEIREEKRKELIAHGYALPFTIDDIEEIGVTTTDDKNWIREEAENGQLPKEILQKVRPLTLQ